MNVINSIQMWNTFSVSLLLFPENSVALFNLTCAYRIFNYNKETKNGKFENQNA